MKTSKFSLLVISIALGLAFESNPSACTAQDIVWQPDVESAILKAEAENKLVLMHFTASWCRPCQALEKFVFPNLEVARSVNEHVVPVRIDVDQKKTLVTEYGVTAVPFDVILTPRGRVITKMKSPLDSNGFQRMMARLSLPMKELEDKSNIAISQKLNEFSNQFEFKQPQQSKLTEFKNNTPTGPSHAAPTVSDHSAQLARRNNRVANPFFADPVAEKKPAPKRVTNSFEVVAEEPKKSPAIEKVSNEFAVDGAAATDKVTFPNLAALNDALVANTKPKQKQIKLPPPKIVSDFQDITGAQQQQAFQMKQQSPAKVEPEVSPQLSFQSQAGPQLTQLMKRKQEIEVKPTADGFAANVAPKQIQQDRFFQPPTPPEPKQFKQTRVVKPTNTAQALLKPVHQLAQRTQQALASKPMAGSAPQLAGSRAKGAPFAVKTPSSPGAKVQQLLQPQPQPSEFVANLKPAAKQPLPTAPAQPQVAALAAKPAVGLKGKCPVTLLQEGRWVEGDAKFGCIHRDRVYIFADAEKLKAFRSNPDFFSPILAGYDPVVFHKEGQLVDGIAEHGVFMGKAPHQRVLLFRDAQTRALFQANPSAYMNTVRQAMKVSGSGNAGMMR